MASQPILSKQPGARPLTSVPYSIFAGDGPGSAGIDGRLAHGASGNQTTLIIQVADSDVEQAIRDLSGVYQFNPLSGYLNRTLPAQHPRFWWLYCSGVVAMKPMRLLGKYNSQLSPFSQFDHWLLTCVFSQPKYPLLSDSALDTAFPPVQIPAITGPFYRQEWMRFCEYTYQSASETLSIEAGTYTYAEGAGTSTTPTAGVTKFNSAIGQHLGKPNFLLTQRQVPYYGLFSPTTRRPENLIAQLTTVNKVAFLGNPAGTLLFTGWNFVFNEAPYDPLAAGIPRSQGQDYTDFLWPSLTVDVTYVFNVFDPPRTGSNRGHNLCPWRGDKPNNKTADPAAFNWYLATADGLTTSAGIFQFSDHRTMFAYAA